MANPTRRGLSNILKESPNDIVILSLLRTPITRANKGHLKDAYAEELLAAVLKATLDAVPSLDPGLIKDYSIHLVFAWLGYKSNGVF
jgi:acetyl-CoA acyltransferase 1